MSAARNRYKRAILLLRADRTAQTTENTKHAAASKRIIPASKGIPAAPAASSVPATYPTNDHLNPANQGNDAILRRNPCMPLL